MRFAFELNLDWYAHPWRLIATFDDMIFVRLQHDGRWTWKPGETHRTLFGAMSAYLRERGK